MNYNPYEAPRAQPFGQGPPGGGVGQPQPWEVSEVLSAGWNAVKRYWPVLVFGPFIAAIIGGIPSMVPGVLVAAQVVAQQSVEYFVIVGVATIVGAIIQAFFGVGLVKIYLAAARGIEPQIGDIFSGGSHFLPALGAGILAGLGTVFGLIFLIIPGILLAMAWSLTTYFIVDANLGPIEAMSASWAAARDHLGNLFVFFLASLCVMIAGWCACCIGLFVAMPVVMVAFATIFIRVTGRMGPANAPQMARY